MRHLLIGLFLCHFISSCNTLFENKKILIYGNDEALTKKILNKIERALPEDFAVDYSLDLKSFHEDTARQYAGVFFIGEFDHKLGQLQQTYLERYYQAGGMIGLMNASLESSYQWPWYDDIMKKQKSSLEIHINKYERIIVSNSMDVFGQEEIIGYLQATRLDYANSTTLLKPSNHRFTQVVLDGNINEPMELDITHDGRVIFTERHGKIKMYLPKENITKTLTKLDVRTTGNYEDGLHGLALDPNHKTNGWVYFYYSVPNANIQRLSRFFLSYDTLLMHSERKILEVKVQTETCCHSGGSVQFGPDGLLYLSTGDNTNSFESNGYSPIDERPGRAPFDAQKSSANTHDLRGKILRLKVNKDGSYSIPEGNLFPKNGSKGRPEIYVMGTRNPFRISIDAKRNYLYWGDVGPDSGKRGIQGPHGYDEINRAKEAGNYGWPYFVGNNVAYPDWNFSTNMASDLFDSRKPINESPNNTGSRSLPKAQPAMISYPYSVSEEWPVLGKGARTAMVGPVYYSDLYHRSGRNFPSYYDGKLLIYDWSRRLVQLVIFDKNNEVYNIEPFLPELRFSKLIDMEFGPDGALYLLEYGLNYLTKNDEAKLSRIEFTKDNRDPIAAIELDKTVGAAPLTVNFSAINSFDYDKNDKLEYEWSFSDGNKSNREIASFTFEKPGVYRPKLIVRDQLGATSEAKCEIFVGNEPPKIEISFEGNQSFYFGHHSLMYNVDVQDDEEGSLSEGSIQNKDVNIQFHYIPQGKDLVGFAGNNAQFNPFIKGSKLIDGSDCKSCHDMSKASVGPSYESIAGHYTSNMETIKKLGQKIIDGGNGVWGHSLMAAHPQHTLLETKEMVKYILSLDEENKSSADVMPSSGEIVFDKHLVENEEASYIMSVRYKDKGANGMPALSRQENIIIRHPKLQAEDYDNFHNVGRQRPHGGEFSYVKNIRNGSYISFKNIDLTDVNSVTFNLRNLDLETIISLRIDDPQGENIGEIKIENTGTTNNFYELKTYLKPLNGLHEVFVYFENEGTEKNLLYLDWLEFEKKQIP